MAIKRIDLTGQRFGKLVVTDFIEVALKSRLAKWRCSCDCGKQIITTGKLLRSGESTSCGCARNASVARANKARLETHGMSGSREYRIWTLMRNRCENHGATNYARYGGRGISVCHSWKNFETFFADMGYAGAGMTLDRIDNDAGYCKENCRWASKQDQANNRTSSRIIEHRGQKKTLSQWADMAGVKVGTLHARLKSGWSTDRALSRVQREFA